MAAIGNIRKHYGLLVAIVGLALLAFVLGDLFKSTNSRQGTNVATVGNEKITNQDYSNLVNMNLENMKASNGSITTEQNYSIHANTLEQMIRDIIMKKEYKNLGLVVSSDELYDQFLGENPNQYVVSSFTGADGKFNKELVKTYIRDFQTLTPEMKANWLNFESAIKEDRLNTKYDNLLKKSFYLPSKLAARYYSDKNDKTSAEVYAVRYTTIADSTVVLNDADKKAFYNENKNKYQTDETRAIDYIVFEIKPSQTDIDYSRNFVNDLKADFAAIENPANFVNANSDLPFDSTWKSRKDVPAEFETEIFNCSTCALNGEIMPILTGLCSVSFTPLRSSSTTISCSFLTRASISGRFLVASESTFPSGTTTASITFEELSFLRITFILFP